MTEIHFVDVGCGNMQIIRFPSEKTFIYDCNITDDNEERVMSYVKKAMGAGTKVDVFINSHRDADHMRGIKKLHKKHKIKVTLGTPFGSSHSFLRCAGIGMGEIRVTIWVTAQFSQQFLIGGFDNVV